MQTAAFRFILYSIFSIPKNPIQLPFHCSRLGKFQRIRLTDMVGGDAVTLCKAQNVADGNAVDDLGRRKPIDLLGKDMFQPGVVVRENLPHLLTAVEPLDDLRNVQTGLHVGVEKGLAGVIEAAGVFLLQQVHHLLHHPFWGEDLVGFLGRDVVEDILGAALVEVIRQLDLQVQKLLHRIVKHHRVEQVACKVLLLSGGLVDVRSAVPQKRNCSSVMLVTS